MFFIHIVRYFNLKNLNNELIVFSILQSTEYNPTGLIGASLNGQVLLMVMIMVMTNLLDSSVPFRFSSGDHCAPDSSSVRFRFGLVDR